MHAIILAGGLGTRLRSILSDVPKPMAPIQNKPFLAYLLDYLSAQGVTRVTLGVHHLREKIQTYFQSHYAGMAIDYAVENEPLGTGGAIAYALSISGACEPVLVLNGDTFVKLNYQALYARHRESGARLTMALSAMDNCQRYGKVMLSDGHVIAFKEKGEGGPGFINAGVYVMDPVLFSSCSDMLLRCYPECNEGSVRSLGANNTPRDDSGGAPRDDSGGAPRAICGATFSFEQDFLFPHLATIQPAAFIAQDYFIDIGVPEDYARAQLELPSVVAVPV